MDLDNLQRLEASVDKGFEKVHVAAVVGESIFQEYAAETGGFDSIPLVSKFKQAVEKAGLESILLPSRIEYAERLALYPAPLLYEEMLKLLSLCQQVVALQSFGYAVDNDTVEHYVASVSAKLYAERREASPACEALGLGASHNFWQRSGITPPQRRKTS